MFDTGLLEGRVIVTNNVPDFESLRRAREAAGERSVPGLIYTSDVAFPRTRAYVARLAAALEAAAAGHEASRRGGVLWLRPPAG
ncbi:MAG TPA: hypothetical protein VIZ43_14175 [Trebonia sp.]